MSGSSGSGVRLYLVNAASSVATRVLQLTVFVWVNQYLLRRIAPEEYSLFPIVVSLMFFAEIFRNMLTGGMARFIVEADSRDDHQGVTAIVSSMFPIVLAASAVFALAGVSAVANLSRLINVEHAYLPQAQWMLAVLVFSLCITVATSPFVDGAYVRQRFVALNLIDLGCEAIRIAILMTLLFAVSTKVMWLVVASSGATIANISLRMMLTRRLVPSIRFQPGLFSWKTARPLIRFGAWTSIQGITSMVSSTVPALMLNRFATPLDVASFHLGRLPEIQIRGLAAVAAGPALPAMTRLYATKGESALNDLYYRGGRYFLWLTLLLVAPLLVFGREIIVLYAGATYTPAALVMVALLGAYPFLWASAMFFQVAYAVGRIRAYYICDVVVQVVTLLSLYYTLAWRGWGAPGAGLAIGAAGAIVHLVLLWPMGLQLVRGRWSAFALQTLVPGLLPFAVALLSCFLFRSAFVLDGWWIVAAGGLLSGASYLVVLVTLCLDPQDRELASGLFRRLQRLAVGARSSFSS